MFTLNTLSKTIARPSQLSVVQRALSTAQTLPAKCKGTEERKKKASECKAKKAKTCEEKDMDKFKDCKDGGHHSEFNCNDAMSEISHKIGELERQMKAMNEIQKVISASVGAKKCPKVKESPYKCKIKPPKKLEEKERSKIPYLLGLIAAAVGGYFLYDHCKDKKGKDDKEKDK